MAKTKISEFSATPGNNTDIDSINIAEGCAPSGINDAIRELMAQLKDFQTGAVGDSFNGPVGTTTAAAGAFTTLAASGAVTLSGGTANGVPYLNGSKVLTSGSALTFDGTNTLKLKNTLTCDRYGDNTEGLTISTNSGNGVYNTFGGLNHVWQLAATEGMRLTSTGLGIGTSSPNFKLEVIQDQNAASYVRFRNNDTGSSAYAGVLVNASGNQWAMRMGSAAANSNALQFVIDPLSANVTRMTLDSSGNLGLGVTPSAWSGYKAMQIGRYGAISSSTGSDALNITSNCYYNGTNWIYSGSYFATRYINDDGIFKWFNAPSGTAGNAITFTQAMTLDASGNLLVGTTSSGTGFQNGLTVNASNLSSTSTYLAIGHANGVASGNSYLAFLYNGGVIGSVTQNGTTQVLYNVSSDHRLKDITGPVTGTEAKDFIMALQPKQGTWKADDSRFVGFVAHEFQEVSPLSVTGTKDAVDAEGNPVMQAMQASSPEVMANLIAHIQNLEQRLAALEAA